MFPVTTVQAVMYVNKPVNYDLNIPYVYFEYHTRP